MSKGAPVRVDLDFPIEVRSAQSDTVIDRIDFVMIRRPKVGDMRAVGALFGNDASDWEVGLALLERLTGLAKPMLDAMDASDMARCEVVLAGFTERSLNRSD